ncbi:MAG TPA: GerW family sporulation protein [Candidatus Fimadaptatus faecigallinarum]|uniref:GerW family sporulation protein n=1 Tax=Candidatus Fimadaptatus faecigallinarum TaxID=2840814 RepID=A0A9D1S4Y9_9FIRM|nr:GerW family sporulation protein [Candidatus Fimadaptatus faecigallinarum]
MENSVGVNQIQSIMSTTMENLKDMIDVNVVVGDAVETGAGATIIPISRVSFGFVSGGGEYSCPPQTPRLPFAGGAGTGVSVNPMGFLVVSDGQVKLLPAQYYAPIDRVIEQLPGLLGELKNRFKDNDCQRSQSAPDCASMRSDGAHTGAYAASEMPEPVSSETARDLPPAVQGSFEDPRVRARNKSDVQSKPGDK